MKLNLKIILIFLVFLSALGIGYLVWHTATFRVVKTDPKLSNFPDVAPDLRVYFSKDITTEGFNYKASKEVVTGYQINGKTLTLNLNNAAVQPDKTYSIIIQNIASKSGKNLRDINLTFKAVAIPSDKISERQQKELQRLQDIHPYQVDYITYENFDLLIDYGLTIEQQRSIKTRLFDYSNIVKKNFWKMELVPGTITTKVHDSESADTTDTVSFVIILGGQRYTVTAQYQAFANNVTMTLIDQKGTLIYDSSDLGDH